MKVAALLVLFVAIVSEVVGTAGLEASEGFSRVVPVLVVVVAYSAAFYFLSPSLRQIPLGVAYAIWSGLGTVGAVLVGVIVWQESLGPARLIGIGLIVIGVVMLNVFAEGSRTQGRVGVGGAPVLCASGTQLGSEWPEGCRTIAPYCRGRRAAGVRTFKDGDPVFRVRAKVVV